MLNSDILKKSPFNLNNEQVSWVETTISNMTLEEKIGQLFILIGMSENEEMLKQTLSLNPGGVMFRPMSKDAVQKAHSFLQENSKLPLFLAANLEAGANGLFAEGTNFGSNMLVAATGDEKQAYNQGMVCMSEASEIGGNMSFAPVSDINYNFLNPITNTRSYGDNPELVTKMVKAYTTGVQENGGFAVMKHFPGDGVDGRDHHTVRTINPLSFKNWSKTFGEVYRQNIENGVSAVMVGHISLPSYFEEKGLKEGSDLPASLSPELLQGLLRKDLGFNGLIMTDATLMGGFMQAYPRKECVPRSIAAGNDMFLFTKNPQEDFMAMLEGYKTGIITEERLNEALTRILGLKAKLKTMKATANVEENRKLATNAANQAITLVKDEANILPLKTGTKIGIIDLTNKSKTYEQAKAKFEAKGCEVVDIDLSPTMADIQNFMRVMFMPIEELKKQADVFVYITNNHTKSNSVSNRVEYKGMEFPWFVADIPTVLLAFGSPYNGYDFADVKTQINCYHESEFVVDSTVNKLFGEEFVGASPVKLDYEYFNERDVFGER